MGPLSPRGLRLGLQRSLIATVGLAFILPGAPATNVFLQGSVFLAFAYLYPDFEMYLFFILPVKIKWLALVTWIGYGVVMIFGSWEARLMVLASATTVPGRAP